MATTRQALCKFLVPPMAVLLLAPPTRSAAAEIVALQTGPLGGLESIGPPVSPGSAFPALSVEGPTTGTTEDQVLLTWVSPSPAGPRFEFSRWAGGVWSSPVTIAPKVEVAGPPDRPVLAVIETQAVRRTLIARTGDVVGRSADAGRSWDRLPARELPFASMVGGDDGAFAFWLASNGDGTARLLGTRVLAGESLLDPLVADGSGTAAAMTWDGPIVVYRDRDATGAEDLSIVRREAGRWTAPGAIARECWRPEKTPGSGPAISASRRRIAVAWYSEAQGSPALWVAFSGDAGRTFGAPVKVDSLTKGHAPWGPVAVALDEKGDALVLWLSLSGSTETTLLLSRVAADGRRGEPVTVARGRLSSAKGEPQLAVANGRAVIAWVEGGSASGVRVATLLLAEIPPALEAASQGGKDAVAEAPLGRGRVGDTLPDLSVDSASDRRVSPTSLRGRAVLLNLWATWCAPCLAEMPELSALDARYRAKGLTVVGVNGDVEGSAEKVRAFVAARKLPFEVWLDPEMSFNRALRVQGLPTTFVIDRAGRIATRFDRPITAEDPELLLAIEKALGGPK